VFADDRDNNNWTVRRFSTGFGRYIGFLVSSTPFDFTKLTSTYELTIESGTELVYPAAAEALPRCATGVATASA